MVYNLWSRPTLGVVCLFCGCHEGRDRFITNFFKSSASQIDHEMYSNVWAKMLTLLLTSSANLEVNRGNFYRIGNWVATIKSLVTTRTWDTMSQHSYAAPGSFSNLTDDVNAGHSLNVYFLVYICEIARQK